MLWFTLPLLFVSGSLAQLPGLGSCPTTENMTNFDPASYAGRWYESYRSFAVFEVAVRCVTAEYTVVNDTTLTVVNTDITSGGETVSISGTATVEGEAENGILSVKFSSLPYSAPYKTLGTDYENWAAVFSCTTFGYINFQFYWVLTRELNPPQTVVDEAFAVFTDNGLSTKCLMKTNQTGCSSS